MKRALCLLLCGLSLAARAADYPDLPDAATARRVIERHPSVLAARANLRLEEANRQQLQAGPHETVLRLSGQQRTVRTTPGQRFGEWDVGLERAFRLPGKASLDAALGEQGVVQARLMLGDALHEAARGLLKAWFAWLREASQVRLWEEQTRLLEQQLAAVDSRIRVGDAPRLERLAAQAALAQAQAGLAQSRFQARAAATELERRFPGLTLPDPPVLGESQAVEHDAATWRQRVLDHNHELAVARAESVRSRLAVARAEADRVPDPSVGMRVARERGGEEDILGLTLSIPFGGAARTYAVDGAQAQAEMAAQREAAVAARLSAEAENLFHAARAAHASALSASQAASQLEDAARLAARAYALGEGTLADVLTARRLALDARRAATLAVIDAQEARYRLLLDSHRLWPIDPDEHAEDVHQPAAGD